MARNIREMPGGSQGDSASKTQEARLGIKENPTQPWEAIIRKIVNG